MGPIPGLAGRQVARRGFLDILGLWLQWPWLGLTLDEIEDKCGSLSNSFKAISSDVYLC